MNRLIFNGNENETESITKGLKKKEGKFSNFQILQPKITNFRIWIS